MTVKPSLSEAKSLFGHWSKGTFPTIAECIKYHFMRHREEILAEDVWQYLRKSMAFSRNLRGSLTVTLDNGAVRYTKKGYYVIKDVAGKILSFGTE